MSLLHQKETAEERKLRIDAILEKNSQPPMVCISCLELISDRETAVSGPMGPYHGYPYTCVEGRSDEDIPWYQK